MVDIAGVERERSGERSRAGMTLSARARRVARATLLWGVRAAAAFAALAVAGVAVYRFVDPPVTWTMAQRFAGGAEIRHAPVAIDAISPHLVRAVIAAEDSRFCSHAGFDHAAIAQAMAEARNGRRLRGASTISQQTAKNAYLWTGGGWARKGVEAGFTLMIEAAWPKRRIMQAYLNAAEWGDGLFGAEAAAQARFGKSAAEVSQYEAALMASVLPSPNNWRLDPPSEYVSSRASTLLRRMDIVERDALADCVLAPERRARAPAASRRR